MTYEGELYEGKKKDFLNFKPIAVDQLNYHNKTEVIDILHDIDEKLIVKQDGKIHILKIYYGENENDYFILDGRRYFLENFIRYDSIWGR